MDVVHSASEPIKHPYFNRPMKNRRSHAKAPCKCLTCAKPIREEFEGLTILVCEDEACFLECDRCTERPSGCSGYKPLLIEAEVMAVG